MTEPDLLNDLGSIVMEEVRRQVTATNGPIDLRCNAVAGRVVKRLRELGAVIEPAKYPLTYPPVSVQG